MNARSLPATRAALGLGLGLLVLAVFSPVLQAGFVNWDDPETLLDNPRYRGLSLEHLRWMWTTSHMGHFQPLSWLSFALDHALWGLDPRGYHATNLALHLLASLLFWRALVQLAPPTSRGPREEALAALVAALFAVHPQRAEAVAWLTERRDVLSMALAQAALLAWLRHVQAPPGAGRGAALLCGLFFLLSLLAKAHLMTFPLVLLLLDHALGRARARGWRALLVEKLPFLPPALFIAARAGQAQAEAGAALSFAELGAWERLINAGGAVAWYLGKAVLPLDLRPLIEREPGLSAEKLLAALPAVLLSLAALGLWRRLPAPSAAWLAFLVLLAPVSGLAQAGPQAVADRYSYFSLLPLHALLFGLLGAGPPPLARPLAGLLLLLLLPLAGAGHAQVRHWQSGVTLWSHAARLDPDSEIVLGQLALALLEEGEAKTAEGLLLRALERGPARPELILALGRARAMDGRLEQAISDWSQVPPDTRAFEAAQANIARARALLEGGEAPP